MQGQILLNMLKGFGINITPEQIEQAGELFKNLPAIVENVRARFDEMERRNQQIHFYTQRLYNQQFGISAGVEAAWEQQVLHFMKLEQEQANNAGSSNSDSGDASAATVIDGSFERVN